MVENEKPANPGRLWRVLLVVSLALNVAILGLIGGALMRDKSGRPPPAGFDLSAGPLGQALSPQDRRAIGREVRGRREVLGDLRDSRRRTLDAFRVALTNEPFDRAALEAVMDENRSLASRVQTVAQEALLDRIAAMSHEERVALAERMSKARKSR